MNRASDQAVSGETRNRGVQVVREGDVGQAQVWVGVGDEVLVLVPVTDDVWVGVCVFVLVCVGVAVADPVYVLV